MAQSLHAQPAASPFVAGHGAAASALHIIPLQALTQEAAAVRMVLCISLEEILPRPKAGLLSRMLRLADVGLVTSPGAMEPVYLLHPGGEYHIGVSLFHPPSGQRVPVGGAAWVQVAVADGQAVSMDVEEDQGLLPRTTLLGAACLCYTCCVCNCHLHIACFLHMLCLQPSSAHCMLLLHMLCLQPSSARCMLLLHVLCLQPSSSPCMLYLCMVDSHARVAAFSRHCMVCISGRID